MQGARVIVVGIGKSGVSAAKLCARLGATVVGDRQRAGSRN
ncbi:MAG: hypothetical protein QM756_31355 [Polyangiaceae bacterium]